MCIPSAIDTSNHLPPDERFEQVKNVDFYGKGLLRAIHAKLAGITLHLEHLSGYEEYARLLKEPEIRNYEFSRWTSDVEFGRQILNGVNPVVIRRCESLPTKFPVTTEMVKSSLHRGLTLEQEIKVTIIHILSCNWHDCSYYTLTALSPPHFVNPRRACTARVTVVGSVCLSVTKLLTYSSHKRYDLLNRQ